ncbi:hypothetical protein Leryth_005901 [Lithospermum erythrorhizon]|nr:hypothetical protein Leryth_005901 [Lithospermum erythrorhizon]
MSYLHHHHHQPYHPTPPNTTTCHCCCSHTNYPPCYHPPPPPNPHLHHPPPPPPLQPHFPTPYTPQIHQFTPPLNPYHFQEPIEQQQQQHLQPIISSLLSRISALETSLKCYGSTSASHSLRDAAARTIQTHFRSFILHRSRTLGDLKNLASIKSTLNALKSSISRNGYVGHQALYAKATNLVLRLDSIQGGDPMIRDGKMSISRELNQFFKLIDGVSLKKSELSSRILKNVRCGGNNTKPRDVYSDQRGDIDNVKLGRLRNETMKLREQIRRIGELDIGESDDDEYEDLDNLRTLLARKKGVAVSGTGGIKLNDNSQARAKRSVRFADNEVIRSRNEPVRIGEHDSGDDDGDLSDDDQLLVIDDHRRETQENGILRQEKLDDKEEGQTEDDEGSSPGSNGGSDVAFPSRSRGEAGRTNYAQSEDGSFTFCAPLPVKMEPRADLMSRMKLVK